MTTTPKWEQWDGAGFPSERFDSPIYYYPGKVDIEDPTNLQDLILEIHLDGVASSRTEARTMTDKAVVTHGQTTTEDGQVIFYSGSKDEFFDDTKDATWVELVGYDD